MIKVDIKRIIRFRAERLRGFTAGIILMILDELISPLTVNAKYQLPYFLSAYTRAVFIPSQFLWEFIFIILTVMLVFV
jgi:hypothetical protein